MTHVPSQALESEAQVIGGALMRPEAIDDAVDILRGPGDFFDPRHGIIWAAIVDLWSAGKPVDETTVAESLRWRRQLEKVGGSERLTEIGGQVATAEAMPFHARAVRDCALTRALMLSGSRMAQRAADVGAASNIRILLDEAQRELFALSEDATSEGYRHLREIGHDGLKALGARTEEGAAGAGVPTGFPDLDALTAGLHASELVIIAARPSMGKSALASDIALSAALEYGHPALICSVEMSADALWQRMISARSGVHHQKIRTGRMSQLEMQDVMATACKISEAPLAIDERGAPTVLEIRAAARRFARDSRFFPDGPGLGLVVVDYLQLVRAGEHRGERNREQEVSENSAGLKALAKELHWPVLVVSQLNRACETRSDKRPMLSDLRESGCLTGDSRVYLADEGVYRQIGELVGCSGFRVMAVNTETWKVEPRRVERAFATGRKPVYRLTTRLGRSIRATANHRFLAFEGWRRLDEFAAGVRLALPRRLAAGVTTRQFQAELGTRYCGSTLYRSGLSRERAERVAKIVDSDKLRSLATSDVYWDEVVSVKPDGEEEVYDLTVEGLHNFVADNICVHNSIEQDADAVAFVYRPDYYERDHAKHTSEAEIIVAKQRNGPTDTVTLRFDNETVHFQSLSRSGTWGGPDKPGCAR